MESAELFGCVHYGCYDCGSLCVRMLTSVVLLPSELGSRAGIDNVSYHAKIKLERAENLDRFRRYAADGEHDSDDAVSVLVCTDLASRGLNVPGVTAVVQLQFVGNVVAHLLRMGRCGRAGNRNGRGIVLYSDKEREHVQVVRDAEFQQERMILDGDAFLRAFQLYRATLDDVR